MVENPKNKIRLTGVDKLLSNKNTPSSDYKELQVLNAILNNNALIKDVSKKLRSADFLNPWNKLTFLALKKLIKEYHPSEVDLFVLKDACKNINSSTYWLNLIDAECKSIDKIIDFIKSNSTALQLQSIYTEGNKEIKKLNPYNLKEFIDKQKSKIDLVVDNYKNNSTENSLFSLGCVDSEEFTKEDLPEQTPLLAPFLYQGDYVGIIGAPGMGKTTLAQIIALALVREPGLITIGGWIPEKSVSVLYLDAEMGEKKLQKKDMQLKKYLPSKKVEKLTYFSGARLVRKTNELVNNINLFNAEHRDMITEYIQQFNFDVLIIDNLMSFTPSWDNLAKEEFKMNINQWIVSLRHSGKTIILLCHTGKDESRGAMGPADITFNMDCNVILSHPKDYKSSDGCYFQVKYYKPPRTIRPGDEMEPFTLKLQPEGENGLTWHCGNVKAEQNEALTALIIDNKMSGKDIANVIGATSAWISKKKARLKEKGYLTSAGRATQEGLNFIKGFNFEPYYLDD